jgi:hypothetical protein
MERLTHCIPTHPLAASRTGVDFAGGLWGAKGRAGPVGRIGCKRGKGRVGVVITEDERQRSSTFGREGVIVLLDGID